MFTQNQVRLFYVANAKKDTATGLTTAGDIMVQSQGNDLYFNFVNADGEVMRTDLIDKSKIMSITATPSLKQKYTSKATHIVLNSDVIEDSKVIPGQDYMLNIRINQMYWKSDQVWGYKYGVVHSDKNMYPSDFYKEMALSTVANMSREAVDMIKVYLVKNNVTVASSIVASDLYEVKENDTRDSVDTEAATAYGIVIDEAEQPWRLGQMPQEPVLYEAKSDEIVDAGQEIKWGKETIIPGFTVIENGKKICDMEWFYHGERGDIYRESGYPNNWPNQMLADKNKKYDTIDIHYYWNGANHAVQKSEKDITLACVSATGAASGQVVYKVIQALASNGVNVNATGYNGTDVYTVQF